MNTLVTVILPAYLAVACAMFAAFVVLISIDLIEHGDTEHVPGALFNSFRLSMTWPAGVLMLLRWFLRPLIFQVRLWLIMRQVDDIILSFNEWVNMVLAMPTDDAMAELVKKRWKLNALDLNTPGFSTLRTAMETKMQNLEQILLKRREDGK